MRVVRTALVCVLAVVITLSVAMPARALLGSVTQPLAGTIESTVAVVDDVLEPTRIDVDLEPVARTGVTLFEDFSLGLVTDLVDTALGSGACGLTPCVEFASVFDPDGPGPMPAHDPRLHHVPVTVDTPLSSLLLTPVDVTGNGDFDIGIGVHAEAELSVSAFEGVRVVIAKLPGAPSVLPLRIEAVADVTGLLADLLVGPLTEERLTFGYDTLATTAPDGFVAEVDLRNRDGLETTSQMRLGLDIDGPGESLAVVSDAYKPGLAHAERLDPENLDVRRTRLAYSGDADRPATRVPSRASVELTSGTSGTESFQRFSLDRSEPTVLQVHHQEQDADPLLTGTVDLMPSEIELTISELGQGCEPDQRISYDSSDTVADIRLGIERLVGSVQDTGEEPDGAEPTSCEGPGDDESGGTHRQRLDATIEDLPEGLTIDYSAADGEVAYRAADRVPRVALTATAEQPLLDGTPVHSVDLELADLPESLEAGFSDGRFEVGVPNGALGRVELVAKEQPGTELPSERACRPDDGPAAPDCDDGLGLLRDPTLDGALLEDSDDRYLLVGRIHNLRSASVQSGSDVSASLDTGDREDGRRAPFAISVRAPHSDDDPTLQDVRVEIDRLQPATEVARLANADDTETFAYSDSGEAPGPAVTVTGLNLDVGEDGKGFTGDLHLGVDDLPSELEVEHGESEGTHRIDYTSTARDGATSRPSLELELVAAPGEQILSKAEELVLELDDLPDELEGSVVRQDQEDQEGAEGLELEFEVGDDRNALGRLQLTATERDQEPPTERDCRPDGLECDFGIDVGDDDGLELVADPDLDGLLFEDTEDRFVLLARVHELRSAKIETEPLNAELDTADRDSERRPFDISARLEREDEDGQAQDLRARIDPLQPETQVSYVEGDGQDTFAYRDEGSGPPPSVTVEGLNLEVGDEFTGDLRLKIEDLPKELELIQAGDGEARSVTYTSDPRSEAGQGPSLDLALIAAPGERVFGDEAEKLELRLDDLPDEMSGSVLKEDGDDGDVALQFQAGDGTGHDHIGEVEVVATSRNAAPQGLDAEIDGAFLRDTRDEFVLHARLKRLSALSVALREAEDVRVVDPPDCPPLPPGEPPLPGCPPGDEDDPPGNGDGPPTQPLATANAAGNESPKASEIEIELDADSPAEIRLDLERDDGIELFCEGSELAHEVVKKGAVGTLFEAGTLPRNVRLRIYTVSDPKPDPLVFTHPVSGIVICEEVDDEGDSLLQIEYAADSTGEGLSLEVLGSADEEPTELVVPRVPREAYVCSQSRDFLCSGETFNERRLFAFTPTRDERGGSLEVAMTPHTRATIRTESMDLTAALRRFVYEGAKKDGLLPGASTRYWGIHTGWDSESGPPEQDDVLGVRGSIRTKRLGRLRIDGNNEFGGGDMAADRLLVVVSVLTGGALGGVEFVGSARCSSGTSLSLANIPLVPRSLFCPSPINP